MKTPAPKFLLLIALSFFAIYIGWGLAFLFIRRCLQATPPLFLASLRYGISGLFLLLFSGGLKLPTLAEFRRNAIAAVVLYGTGGGIIIVAQRFVASGIAALVLATTPMWLLLLHCIVERKSRHRWIVWPGVAMGLLGVAFLIFSQGIKNTGHGFFPYFLLLGGALSWSVGTIYLTHHQKAVEVIQHEIGRQMILGAVILFGASLCLREPITLPSGPILFDLGSLVVITIFGMIGYYYLLCHVSSVAASTYAFVNPLVALAAGALFEAEKITPSVLLSATLIITSLLLILKSGKPEENLGADG